MLVHVEHVHQGVLTFIRLASHLGDEPGELSAELEKLSLSNSQVALCCNELAASLLTVIKTAPCTTSKELSSEVQSLSHEIARAGKNLNHLLKKMRVSRKVSGRTQPQIPQISTAGRTVPTTNTDSREAVMVEQGMKGSREEREGRKKNDVLMKENVTENTRSERGILANAAMEHGRDRLTVHLDSTVKTSSSSVTDSTLEEPTASEQSSSPSGGRVSAGYQDLTTCSRLSKPLEQTVKHTEMSNATGQVISESPSNSPPHQAHPQNGYSAPNMGHMSDEEDSSII